MLNNMAALDTFSSSRAVDFTNFQGIGVLNDYESHICIEGLLLYDFKTVMVSKASVGRHGASRP